MLSKFSLQKPLTVFVAVILVLVLGVVSFTGMTTDLLPSMDMPYVVVYTTYPGASSEKVEQTVTKPMESDLATVGGVEIVQSSSSENVSVVILQFAYSTNMDTAMIDLNNKLSSISASFDDDMIGTPVMMQIDPNMLPVMVASVSLEGAGFEELTKITQEVVLPALERADGIAGIEATGLLTHTIEIVLDTDRIDTLNQKIVALTNEAAADALAQLQEGKKALAAAEAELNSKKSETAKQLAEGGIAIADGKTAISVGITALDTAMGQVETFITILDPIVDELLPLLENLDREAFVERIQGILEKSGVATEALGKSMRQIANQLAKIDPDKIDWDAMKSLLNEDPELIANLEKIQTYVQATFGEEGSMTASAANLALSLESLTEKLDKATNTLETESDDFFAEVDALVDQLVTTRDTLKETVVQLPETKAQLEEQQLLLTEQQSALESGKIIAAAEFGAAASLLQSKKDQIASGEEQIQSALDAAAKAVGLDALLTQSNLSMILTAQNFSMPAGFLEENGVRYTVKVGDSIESLEELKELPLYVTEEESLGTITLSDVAEITILDNSEDRFAKVNGQDGVLLNFQKQSTASTNEVSDNLREIIAQLEKEHEGLKISAIMDQGIYINIIIGTVFDSLLYGAILAVIVLLLFLRSFKSTLVVAVSIPISLLLAIVLMYFTNVSINIISLAGLALGVGMLVDNSIVVIENIYRLRSLGVPAGKAALEGAKQVAAAVTASTLTTVCVFLPIVFTEGLSKQLFTDMGLTIAYSLLASLLVALTLVPVMSATLLKKMKEKKKEKPSRLLNVYGKTLAFCLRQKWLPLLLAIGLLAFSVYGTTQMGTAFIPNSVSDQMTMTVTLPEDADPSVAQLRQKSLEVMDKLLAIKDVETVGVYEGGSSALSFMSFSSGSSDGMTLYIVLAENKTRPAKETVAEIKELTTKLEGCVGELSTVNGMMSLMASGMKITIKGQDLDVLQDLANDVAGILENTKGLVKVDNGLGELTTELRVHVAKEKAMKYSLTVAQVYQQVAAALNDSITATTLSLESENISVLLQKSAEEKLTIQSLKEYPITYTDPMTGEAGSVSLSEIATLEETLGMATISHDNFVRKVSVSADVADGYNIGLVSRGLDEKIAALELPEGYAITIEGENETINSTLRDLILMIVIAILLVYLIMVAQFQSFSGPFVVMFTIPLAMTGGLLSLWICNMELSVISMLGFLVLCGVVVNNGIVFVDTANQLQRQGMERRAALIEAGKMRMRPIYMTTITTVLGLASLALGVGSGSDMLQPMAVVVIFGLLYATLLTLFVVPVLCDGIFMRKTYRSIEVESDVEAPDEFALPSKELTAN